MNIKKREFLPVAEHMFQSNRKISTGSCLKFVFVKIFTDVIREAIPFKGIYTNTF